MFTMPQMVTKIEGYPISPVSFTDVNITGGFWKIRQQKNLEVTIPTNFKKCEETGRVDNFAVAGGCKGEFKGLWYNDSDVFKTIEGAAYCLSIAENPELESYLDNLIEKIACAQEPDGYIYTMRTIKKNNLPFEVGSSRWSYLAHSHELYNAGHLYEAAVAHYKATGKRSLLDVAIKNAELLCSVFGEGKRVDVPGHQEIEIALVKLCGVTGEKKYLELAKFFLDQRGKSQGRELYGSYSQDHIPVIEQSEAVGHSVRAMYMYSGMADVAAIMGDQNYINAIDKIWKSIVDGKIYITGGVGSNRNGEAFDDAYELPNDIAYNETCAAIANMMFNYRLFLLHGDSKYMDVFERILYNGFLCGISIEADKFFYANPLSSDGETEFNHGSAKRQPWFNISCCPTNIARFIPSLSGYIYAVKENSLYVNLYTSSRANMEIGGDEIRVTQISDYPWNGKVGISIDSECAESFSLRLRIPSWVSQNNPLGTNLYAYADNKVGSFEIMLNGHSVAYSFENGYAVISRRWQVGDTITIEFDMPIRKVSANDNVKNLRNKIAIERGPIVYCAEAIDNGGSVSDIFFDEQSNLTSCYGESLFDGTWIITGNAKRAFFEDDTRYCKTAKLTLIPYYLWNNRGANCMEVWLSQSLESVDAPQKKTIAMASKVIASYTYFTDIASFVRGKYKPEHSSDMRVPKHSWYECRGSKEWIQYDFDITRKISSSQVYWFDDTSLGGQCSVPKSWKLLYLTANGWQEVQSASVYGTDIDQFNRVEFDLIETKSLRLELQLREEFSAGVIVWEVE